MSSTAQPTHFRLYSRSYCHLCEVMRLAVIAQPEFVGCVLEVVDVDADPELVEKYDELVPVLCAQLDSGAEVELFHYHFNAEAWAAFFAA